MRLWVTGASGYIGSRLAEVCEADSSIQAVIGTDIRPPRTSSKKLRFLHADINDPSLPEKLQTEKVDTAIHLAFILDPIHDLKKMEHVNLDGTDNFLRAAAELKLKKIVVASSATAYGAHPDNPIPLEEGNEVRGDRNADYPYPQHKAIIDRKCQEFSRSHPKTEVVIVRPTIVIGPNISNFIGRIVLQSRGFSIRGANPPLQYVHEEDVARAFHFLLTRGAPGAYNLTGDGSISLKEAAELAGSKVVELPYGVVRSLVKLLWILRVKPVEAPSGILDFFRYSWVISNEKIKKLGFKFQYSSRAALEDFLRAHGKIARA